MKTGFKLCSEYYVRKWFIIILFIILILPISINPQYIIPFGCATIMSIIFAFSDFSYTSILFFPLWISY
ncbi:MAG: hypothetical protein JW908_06460, partial [Anaerolineales bacterium]|nr:hypothetical protein [Anaerolineales bacterium]